MKKWAYYNEIDPFAAQWLRNLIKANLIAPGVVDERSIVDVIPNEIESFAQCHFFAGIGVWSYALRSAGWDDNRPVWTGSCPCQPFSSAGKKNGFDDERHLWPSWFHLIRICKPVEIFGEQVASKDGLAWLDLVQSDLEKENYANSSVDLCAAGVGAPHIRQRLWLYARKLTNTSSNRWLRDGESSKIEKGRKERSEFNGKLPGGSERLSISDFQQTTIRNNEYYLLANGNDDRQQPSEGRRSSEGSKKQRNYPWRSGTFNSLDDSESIGSKKLQQFSGNLQKESGSEKSNAIRRSAAFDTLSDSKREQLEGGLCGFREIENSNVCRETKQPSGYGPVNGFWKDSDWIYCRDEKLRPIEPGLEPLVNGITSGMVRESADDGSTGIPPKIRKGALKGYGNAINAEVAKIFIETAMKYRP